MKFSTFRGLMFAALAMGGTGVFAGSCYLCVSRDPQVTADPPQPQAPATLAARPPPVPPPARTAPALTAPGASTPGALRPMDSMILARAEQNITGDKVKDAIPGQSWKVNLYKDAGHTGVNRVKVDLDRDDKFDEKWTFERDGSRDEVKRQVSPADDDQTYTEEYRLRAGVWVRK